MVSNSEKHFFRYSVLVSINQKITIHIYLQSYTSTGVEGRGELLPSPKNILKNNALLIFSIN